MVHRLYMCAGNSEQVASIVTGAVLKRLSMNCELMRLIDLIERDSSFFRSLPSAWVVPAHDVRLLLSILLNERYYSIYEIYRCIVPDLLMLVMSSWNATSSIDPWHRLFCLLIEAFDALNKLAVVVNPVGVRHLSAVSLLTGDEFWTIK